MSWLSFSRTHCPSLLGWKPFLQTHFPPRRRGPETTQTAFLGHGSLQSREEDEEEERLGLDVETLLANNEAVGEASDEAWGWDENGGTDELAGDECDKNDDNDERKDEGKGDEGGACGFVPVTISVGLAAR